MKKGGSKRNREPWSGGQAASKDLHRVETCQVREYVKCWKHFPES